MERSIDIEYEGRELTVYYDYQPEEPIVRYYSDGSGYPGCGEQYIINSVLLGDREVIRFVNLSQIEEIISDMKTEEYRRMEE